MNTRIDVNGYESLTQVDRRHYPIFYHTVVAEKALRKPLPPKAVIHHVNEIKSDNRPANLVICPNHAYHSLLHRRIEAKKACGNPSFRKCGYCKKYDDPKNLYIPKVGMPRHRECSKKYQRNRYKNNPEARRKNLANAKAWRKNKSIEQTEEK